VLFLLTGLLLSVSLFAADVPVPQYLRDISVTVRAETSEGTSGGSGAIFTRLTADGHLVSFIWTAGHVVANLRSETTSNNVTLVKFRDAKVIREVVEDGRAVGKTIFDAEVIRYSDAEQGEDLALLRVRKKDFASAETTIHFYLETEIPALGTELYHIGSPHGQPGAHSLTTGIYSNCGRVVNGIVFDQTSVMAAHGSSGGGVFLRDGRYVGMVVRGWEDNFSLNLIVPVRRLTAWAKTVHAEWAINPAVPLE
jgi:S1-C subfamily serine protease